MSYQLLDSGNGEKLEKFGPYTIIRPCQQAIWRVSHPDLWEEADASFSRKEKKGWEIREKMPNKWPITFQGMKLYMELTGFGHIGLFPEHGILDKLPISKGTKVLHLFAYTGMGSILFANKGAKVSHVDASKPSIDWAKENASANNVKTIRWIVEDVIKFMKRELRREEKYDLIVMDPPTFGRGPKKELFKIEDQISSLLDLAKELLSSKSALFFSCHTPGITPLSVKNLLMQTFAGGKIHVDEMKVLAENGWPLPSGVYGIWENE